MKTRRGSCPQSPRAGPFAWRRRTSPASVGFHPAARPQTPGSSPASCTASRPGGEGSCRAATRACRCSRRTASAASSADPPARPRRLVEQFLLVVVEQVVAPRDGRAAFAGAPGRRAPTVNSGRRCRFARVAFAGGRTLAAAPPPARRRRGGPSGESRRSPRRPGDRRRVRCSRARRTTTPVVSCGEAPGIRAQPRSGGARRSAVVSQSVTRSATTSATSGSSCSKLSSTSGGRRERR